jgi:hypothetical protein
LYLFTCIVFGAIGGVYLAYARRTHEVDFLACGVALLLYPYFFKSVVMIVIIGAALAMVPIGRRRGWF